jgi:hypothetical protein
LIVAALEIFRLIKAIAELMLIEKTAWKPPAFAVRRKGRLLSIQMNRHSHRHSEEAGNIASQSLAVFRWEWKWFGSAEP